MGSIETPPATTTTRGIIRFPIPDLSIPPEDRAIGGLTCNKGVVDMEMPIRDMRSSEEIVKGPGGLDVQGFAFVTHESALSEGGEKDWFAGENIEEVYFEEMRSLVKEVTGCKTTAVINCVSRRKIAKLQEGNEKMVHWKGGEMDRTASALPRDRPLVIGKEASKSIEPIRNAHFDYTLQGLRDTARFCRRDLAEVVRPALEKEDEVWEGKGGREAVPRYAAYSVWRPIKTIKRDGLAMLDARTLKAEDACGSSYRMTSDVNASGEYITQACVLTPPRDPKSQRWYWIPQQKPDEVLLIKLADTETEVDPNVAGGCGHCSPKVDGEENEEPRESIECRVLAVWD